MESKIVFNNGPRLSEYEVQRQMNEKRLYFIPKIKDYVANHSRFKNKEVHITFAHKGVASLVCIIEVPEERLVLKLRLSVKNTSEALFLETWENAGIKVPHVVENGMMSGHDYVLMEYIDASILGEVFSNKELREKGMYFQMGRTFSDMHKPEAKGYGDLVDGKTEYEKFADWVRCEEVRKRINYVKDNNLLAEEHGSLEKAIQILTQHAESENKSSYCHGDFGASNIFFTDPITVFDPNPMVNNRYVDLGNSIMSQISHGGAFPEQFVAGYFSEQQCDGKVLQASILFSSYMKFYNFGRTNKTKLIQNIQNYLIQTKHLLA